MSIMQYFNLDSAPLPLSWNPSWTKPDVWFDPSDASTVFVGRTGTVQATAGSPVGQIKDKSGKGNHAVAPTDAARPTLVRMPKSGRRNLLTYTEDLLNPIWVKEKSSIDDLGGGVFKLREAVGMPANAVYGHFLRYNVSLIPIRSSGTFTVEAKAVERTRISLHGRISSSFGFATVDLVTGESFVGQTGNNVKVDVMSTTLLDDGWVRINAKVTVLTGLGPSHVGLSPNVAEALNTGINYEGDGISGVLIRHPQVELSELPTPYQKVTNDFDVTEAGVSDVWYLKFDGVDDVLNVVLPKAINGYILIAGRKGTIIEPVNYVSGSVFSIGVNTYTGGTTGVLKGVGDIVGVTLINKTLSALERDLIIKYYRSKGAKGLLVAGPELTTNKGWPFTTMEGVRRTGPQMETYPLELIDGKIKVARGTDTTFLEVVGVPMELDKAYEVTVQGEPGTTTMTLNAPTFLGTTALTNTAVKKFVAVPTSTSAFNFRFQTVGVVAGATSYLLGLSVKELRAQEDWV